MYSHGGNVTVLGNDHQHINAPSNEVLDLRVLQGFIVIGVGENDVRTEFMGDVFHHHLFAFPAFFRKTANGDTDQWFLGRS